MNIQINSINFCGKQKQVIFLPVKSFFKKQTPPKTTSLKVQSDSFTRTEPDIINNLKNVRCGHYINEGREAIVYTTNYNDYVLRISHLGKFNPEELIPVQDNNGLVIATNESNTVQLMRYVKGEPLYGKNWDITYAVSKDKYMEQFNIIKNLPDESFVEYIKNIINIRKNGYDIDSINPNNILLDGIHLNIVDIEKSKAEPVISIRDFNSIVNKPHIKSLISTMDLNEVCVLADEIKELYDRIINIAMKEGYKLSLKPIKGTYLYSLYYKNLDALKYLIYK